MTNIHGVAQPSSLELSRSPDRYRRFGQLLVHRFVEGFIYFNPVLHQFHESPSDAGLLLHPGQYLFGLGDIPDYEIEEAVLDITQLGPYEKLIKLGNYSLIDPAL